MKGPVLHVISGLRVGGAEGFLVALAAELGRRGVTQHVVSLTAHGPNEARLDALGIAVTVVDPRRMRGGAGQALLALRSVVAGLRPSAIQGWLYHGDLFAALAHRFAPGRRDRVLAWGLRNSALDEDRYGRLLTAAAWLSRWPDVAIANSEAGARFHLVRGYRPRRLAVVPNGTDTARFRPDPVLRARIRRELGIAPERVVAVHCARLDPMKDHPTLLAAAAAFPEPLFLLMGAGTESLGPLPPNVRALGVQDRPEEIYAAGDVVVSSSAFGEGFSNALAEGMAAGLLPVSTDVGDAQVILGDTGPIVPSGDPGALVAALRQAAALPSDERRAGGLAARARIEERFSISRAADGFLAAWALGAGG